MAESEVVAMNMEETLVLTQTSTQASIPSSSLSEQHLVLANELEGNQGFEAELQAFMRAFSADALIQPECCSAIS
ncbi:hypothetical protein RchiOBHm_Chr7g0234211 [Rosa chinensis]|uniref:Uncharacterized protein n=1 Tax=Rosa chinensis TaxID=74649 RepID=A0A2P6PGD7_ROSCH|nr:hypothetical protein RchiOBHm_Chr7g0234211 [Rosa chinensis]